MNQPESDEKEKPRSLLDTLGPGLVTGAADDDPSGIGTYSQVGAQFGYSLGWTMLLSFPLLVAIQTICAEIGAVTGHGIAHNLRRHYSRPLLIGAVTLLLVANTINIGADLGAMAAALNLLVPGPMLLYTFGFGVLAVGLETWLSYDRYAAILKWSTLSLFAYIAIPFVAHLDAREVLHGLLVPGGHIGRDEAMALIALFGTTISPYLFFWQAGQEVEELHRRHDEPLGLHPRRALARLRYLRLDIFAGMTITLITALAIVVATAGTLHAHGITQVTTADAAAEALRPLAGDFSFALFAVGILGTGMLGVPVLAGSVAYGLSETFGWTEGLDRRPREARAFYATIAVATLGGFLLNLLGVDPIRALYWTAVINGLLAPPLMALTLLVARNPHAMGRLAISPRLAAMGWLATAVMVVIGVMFLVLSL